MLNSIIKEDLLYYLWRTKSFDFTDLKTTDGQTIEIVNFGSQNFNSGPDFSEAKIKIGDTLWAGNVEMHVYSSDWERHSHDVDTAYDNVILHIVYEHDREIYTTTEHLIPCLELKDRIDKSIISKYARLINNNNWIPCSEIVQNVSDHTVIFWLQRLTIERLESKVRYLKNILDLTGGDWEETFYISLMRYMGAKVNIEPFETLAKNLPYLTILKNKDNLHHIESLIFGQAGMLKADFRDEYFQNLKSTYTFLAKKYQLKHISPVSWKFAKMRPAGFPTIRLAQVAQILFKTNHLFSKIQEIKDTETLKKLFEVTPSTYWNDHYRFGKESVSKVKNLSPAFIDLIMINVVAPMLFLYGQSISNDYYKEKAISHLEQLKSEKNNISDNFKKLNIKAKSAADSQALIHLKRYYCDHKKCMSCSIGNSIINTTQ